MLISAQTLTRLSTEILRHACGNDTAAATVANRLVIANLVGHDSHGVGMIPAYVDGIKAGELHPDAGVSVVSDKGPFLQLDGNMGFGQVVAEQAMERAIERAQAQGFALMSLRNSFHIGRIGDWAEMAASAGFIAIHYVNVLSSRPLVAPFGGSDARFVTNPYCTAIPATDHTPMIVLDMATSTIAHGKARVAYNAGKSVPENSLIDATGAPTTDPAVMFEDPMGALTTMGMHKGFGLAMLCDILGGSFSGGGAFLPERQIESRIVNNMMAILIDPDMFDSASGFFGDMDRYVDWVKASPPAPGVDQVMVPGDPERRARADRTANGIPVDDGTSAQLLETAAAVGISDAAIAELLEK